MLIPNLFPSSSPITLDVFAENLGRAAGRRTMPLGDPANDREAAERERESVPAALVRLSLAASECAPFGFEAIDTALAYVEARSGIGSFAMPAATLGMLHIGIPHVHTHPPAMPTPLPNIGAVALGGCYSVLLSGIPAARVSDLGFAVSCGCLAPVFQIDTGSSSVFIGNRRAARVCDFTKHCEAQSPFERGVSQAFNVNSIAGAVLKARRSETRATYAGEDAASATAPALAQSFAAEQAGHQLNAAVQAVQAMADATALAFRELMGRDPAVTKCGGVLLTGNPWIFIGGFPVKSTQSLCAKHLPSLGKKLIPIVRDAARAKKLGAWLSGTFRQGRFTDALYRTLRIFTGHPVDVIGGQFVLDAVDAELPGALPIRLARSYSSTWGGRPSPFGHGWSHSLDEAVWREPGQLVYRADDGRELELPLVDHEVYAPFHRLTIRPLPGDGVQIEDAAGILRDFRPISPTPDGLARLSKIHDRRGHRIDFNYTDDRLARVHAPDGREIRLHYHADGHLAQIDLPDPHGDGLAPHMQYAYDGDDLVQITDPLGHVTRYRLDNHRIVEETLANGLRFHFNYDGPGTDAACTRTRGDGGILDHTLIYDRARRTTLVTNACKEPTIVRYGSRGEPLEITDARGAITRHEYDEHLRRTATYDPLGRVTRHEYDARGNCTRTVTPDGATTTVEYEQDRPVAATDPAGGRWRWSYDPQGRPTRRTDPLGRTTTFIDDDDTRTTTVTHPDGRREVRTYDLAGALVRVDLPDGRALHHTYDRRGRLVQTLHPDGARESHHHDLLDRKTRHDLPGGDTRHFNYDDLGCLVRVCDTRTDLRCTYTGLRWLASVGDASTPPFTLERDLEGRVLRVADAGGTLFHAERDACGKLRTCTDARGRRRLTRDLAGRLMSVACAGDVTTYTRDLADRIHQILHPDRTRDEFNYRPDGALLAATRAFPDGATTAIRRELDACARILREWQDDRWVALTHDLRDRITHLRSSSGADIRFNHDDRGLARVGLPGTAWKITCERDRHGREIARHLPGGLTSWWHRDPLGHPLEHGITGSQPPQIHRHRRYTWAVDGRLTGETDLTLRPRARGSALFLQTCPESQPGSPRRDALGRCIARGDTRWQWCGDTPIHTTRHGSHATWVIAATPLARLTDAGAHTIIADPRGVAMIFDEDGALADLALDLPDPLTRLDIFGRPISDPNPALTLLTAVLAAVFRRPPTDAL